MLDWTSASEFWNSNYSTVKVVVDFYQRTALLWYRWPLVMSGMTLLCTKLLLGKTMAHKDDGSLCEKMVRIESYEVRASILLRVLSVFFNDPPYLSLQIIVSVSHPLPCLMPYGDTCLCISHLKTFLANPHHPASSFCCVQSQDSCLAVETVSILVKPCELHDITISQSAQDNPPVKGCDTPLIYSALRVLL